MKIMWLTKNSVMLFFLILSSLNSQPPDIHTEYPDR